MTFEVKVLEIDYKNPLQVFSLVSHKKGSILLHSGLEYAPEHRYTYIFCFPEKNYVGYNLEETKGVLRSLPRNLTIKNDYDFKFAFGVVGYFSYELIAAWENVHTKNSFNDEPYCELGYYHSHIVFDNFSKQAFICVSNYNFDGTYADNLEVENRLGRLLNLFSEPLKVENNNTIKNKPHFYAQTTSKCYQNKVKKALNYIKKGDIFQVNLSQQLVAKYSSSLSLWNYFLEILSRNPSPMSAYYNFQHNQVLSCSPERFISIKNNVISSEPIKGTAARSKIKLLDSLYANRLKKSAKNNAENTMIVDLMRNDLSKICAFDSIQVNKLCELYSYPAVHHLVSQITGKLRPNITVYDILKACFPAGSITGAPKIRAMEIIMELEESHRGAYCGAHGFIDFTGDLDLAVSIRTIIASNNFLKCNVGGGIVFDSKPKDEYKETILKAGKLL